MTTIVDKDHPVLRLIAEEVPLKDIPSARIQGIIKKMSSVLKTQDDGVALAAPQINESLRIFIVSGATIHFLETGEELKEAKGKKTKDLIFINPKIIKLSKETEWMEEGCLSVRYLYGTIKRSVKATITAYDETGKKFQRGASGLLAQIFQHETDHLDGKLFLDKAKNIEDMPPPPTKEK